MMRIGRRSLPDAWLSPWITTSAATIQHQQDAELAKAASFASYIASQADSGGEGFITESTPAAATSGTDGGRM
jgi:hypothetical protein